MSRAARLVRRRTFLRALGLGLPLPLALQMSRLALAQPTNTRPKRLLIFFVPHGAPAEHYDPPGLGRSVDLGASPGVGILKPFKPYQDQFVLLRGIEYVGHASHHASVAVLTGDTPQSIDQVIAKGLSTKPLLLGAISYLKNSFGPDNAIFRDKEWLAAELNPVKAAGRLVDGGAGMPGAAAAEVELQKAALGVGIAELEAMQRELTSLTSAKTRLGIHLDSLRAFKDRAAAGKPGGEPTHAACGAGNLTNLELVRAASMNGANANYFHDKTNFKEIFLAHMEVARTALVCGTRVVGLQTMWPLGQISFGFMGINKDHHDPLSHSRDAAGRAEFAKTQQWIYGQFEEHVLRPLRATPDPLDPAHTVLDNTLVYVCSEVADGNEHTCRSQFIELHPNKYMTHLPLMLIGGGGGSLMGGQAVDFPNRTHKDLLATICNAMGVAGTNFSGSPIREILA